MNVLLFEPSLINFSGHYNRYARVIAAECAQRGIQLSVAANTQISPVVRGELEKFGVEILPIFSHFPYRMTNEPAIRSKISRKIADEALSCFFQMPNANVAWLSGTGALLGAACMFANEANVRTTLQMIDFAQDWPSGHLTAPEDLRKLTRQACDNGLRIFLQSPSIAHHFTNEIGVPAGYFPPILDFKPVHDREPKERPVIGIMNMFRDSKQPWRALDALVAFGELASIALHLGSSATPELVKRVRNVIGSLVQRYKIQSPQIKIFSGILTAVDYYDLWKSLDATILPYDVNSYLRKGSGILFECLSDGKVPIAPAETSMAELMLQENVGLIYDTLNPTGLKDTIQKFLENYNIYLMRSRLCVSRYREKSSPSKIMSILLDR